MVDRGHAADVVYNCAWLEMTSHTGGTWIVSLLHGTANVFWDENISQMISCSLHGGIHMVAENIQAKWNNSFIALTSDWWKLKYVAVYNLAFDWDFVQFMWGQFENKNLFQAMVLYT